MVDWPTFVAVKTWRNKRTDGHSLAGCPERTLHAAVTDGTHRMVTDGGLSEWVVAIATGTVSEAVRYTVGVDWTLAWDVWVTFALVQSPVEKVYYKQTV